MEYNSLISSIPYSWIQCMKNRITGVLGKIDPLSVKIDKHRKNVSDLKCKDCYCCIVREKKVMSTCILRWEALYNVKFEWEYIYCCAFQTTTEKTLQSFQYRVLNRYIPCNVNLCKWKKAESETCNYCNQLDTIEHFLYDCHSTKRLWDEFFDWWYTVSDTTIHCSVLDIIFGIANPEKNVILNVMDFLIIFVKHFVYKSKLNSKELNIVQLKYELRDRIVCEKSILLLQNKCNEYYNVWYPIHTSLL